MVAKVLGLATGALFASLVVWGFTTWRHVSDEDRLLAVLSDHCLPFVLDADTPFGGMGRPIGVYDGIDPDPRIVNGGAAIILDGRFVATWGEIADLSLRICRIDGRAEGGTTQAFNVDPDGVVARVSDAVQSLGDLQLDAERSGGDDAPDLLYQTLGWFEADKPQDRGNRVVMTFVQSQVTTLVVVRDLAP